MRGFEAFWAVCPRKIDKALVRAKYEAVTQGGIELSMRDSDGNAATWTAAATEDELLIGMKAYRYMAMDTEERWIKHPATWLNRGCWLDDPAAVELAAKYDRLQEMKEERKLRVV